MDASVLLKVPVMVVLAAVLLKVVTKRQIGSPQPVDLQGRTFLVTGATSGLGRWHAEALASWNASLVLPVRDLGRGRAFAVELAARFPGAPPAVVEHLDLASLASVRRFAEAYAGPVDVLVHNAAVLGAGEVRRTEDGFEECFQVNYLSTVLLTSLMLERIERSDAGRIVHISAKAHDWGKVSAEAIRTDKMLSPDFVARQSMFMGNLGGSYADSKLAQIMFSAALARRLRNGTVSLSLHPAINTQTMLTRDFKMNPVLDFAFKRVAGFILRGVGFFQSDEDAPKTQIHVSTHPSLQAAGVSGRYFSPLYPPIRNCGKSAQDCAVSPVSATAQDEALQEALFAASCEALGLSDGLCSPTR